MIRKSAFTLTGPWVSGIFPPRTYERPPVRRNTHRQPGRSPGPALRTGPAPTPRSPPPRSPARRRGAALPRPTHLQGPDSEQQVELPAPHQQRQQHRGLRQRQAGESVPNVELTQAEPGALRQAPSRSEGKAGSSPRGRRSSQR